MLKIISHFFTILLFLFIGCSSYQGTRTPAENEDTFLKDAFEAAVSFPFSAERIKGSDNLKDLLLQDQILEFVLDSSLDKENIAFRIEIKNTAPSYRIYFATGALDDTQALSEINAFIIKLNKKIARNIPASVEIYLNAKALDPWAIETLLEIKEATSPSSHIQTQEIKNELEMRIKELKANRTEEKTLRKMGLAALDKRLEDGQFLNLVARGDRKGAADLIKAYLPWEEMAPVEKHFWETYLKVVRDPVPLEDRVLIYRGLNFDPIYSSIVNGKRLSVENAILQGKAFTMAPLMIKNQGSWNRRLRSLETINKKFIAGQSIDRQIEPKAHNARISIMFLNHGLNPEGSPFLSFTPSFATARTFGYTRIASYLIDPRLLNNNYASFLKEEIEFLLPLTTFPDELVGISSTGEDQSRKAYLNEKLENIIAKKYGQDKSEGIIKKIKNNSAHFFKDKVELAAIELNKPPSEFYLKFLEENNFKLDGPAGEGFTCNDLLTLLLKGSK